MDSLEEKYLKLLSEIDQLKDSKQCTDTLNNCNKAYTDCMNLRRELVGNIKDLYAMWLPPKLYSFFSTMKAWIKTGFKKSEYAEARLEICKKCDHFNNNLCSLCGCYMQGKTKMAAASCPISKWKAEKLPPKKTKD